MSRPMTPETMSRNQQGVVLLEVLIAVVIMAIGLLGLAGLQARALQTNASSLQRSQVVMLSYMIIDAMRTDRASAKAGTYNIAKTCNVPSPGALSDNNKQVWLQALKDNLGNTNDTCGQIACDAAGNCTITVWWDDTRAGGGNQESLVTTTRL